jgi:hypothetical protein
MQRREDADSLVRAITDRHHGVMTWLRRYWQTLIFSLAGGS